MTVKEQINKDYVAALKAKDVNAKTALSMVKTMITNAEKAGVESELSDAEIIKLISKAVKQREEAGKIYEDAGRPELSRKEYDEAFVLKRYLPAQMSNESIKTTLREIAASLEAPNAQIKINKAIGVFNKTYPGYDMQQVKALAAEIV